MVQAPFFPAICHSVNGERAPRILTLMQWGDSGSEGELDRGADFLGALDGFWER
jgi:hypothetical protein